MVDFQPILLLPYERTELTRKPGGGRTHEPLVPITDTLRRELSTQVLQLAEMAARTRASASNPLPVKVVLHERALAKSSRPYKFLKNAALPVIAVERPGELIVGGTSDRLTALASAIQTGTSKEDIFHISTLTVFSAWGVSDIFGVSTEAEAAALLQAARDRGAFVKVTFFPWFSTMVQRLATPQGAIGQGPDRPSLLATFEQALGLEVRTANASTDRPVAYLEPTAELTVDYFRDHKSVRSVSLEPIYSVVDPASQPYIELASLESQQVPVPAGEAVVVGVLDSGVDSAMLEPGIIGRETFNVPADRDPWHGTFVSGLVMSARWFNDDDQRFPLDVALVFDAEVMPAGGLPEHLLFERISEVVRAHPEVHVWNCSFGAAPLGNIEYGTLAQDLDALSDDLGVLFVQAAGNFPNLRTWPPTPAVAIGDDLASPAEAIRSMAVGARAHNGGYVPQEMPSSYSRRGPSFALHVKPDVSHWAGDMNQSGSLGGHGVKSIVPSGMSAESVGTSFATPIVSSIAANVWDALATSNATEPRPELVKGLIVHSALLHDQTGIDSDHRNYFGWGTPPSSALVLGGDPHIFTTVHEVVLTPGSDWYKQPFPVPTQLLTPEGKFHGEVLLTLSYAPPINPAFGSEAVRTDVSGAFGYMTQTPEGRSRFRSITPQEVVGGYWESQQVADGKWSPLKSHRKRYPQGTGRGTWALRLSMTERVDDEAHQEQRVFAIVSFRALAPDVDIYSTGVREVNRLGYVNKVMAPATRLRVDG
jgi:hypothetical protein